MMRTIKFRGKDIETGEWVYGFYVRFEDCFRKPIDGKERISHRIYTGFADSCASRDGYDFSGDWHEVDPNTVGQFTGLKDSDGQEIYEGDILTWRSIICEEDPVETWELPVTFYNGCFCLNDDFDMTLISVIYDSEEFGGVKIIGNIHDNPNLLEGGTK